MATQRTTGLAQSNHLKHIEASMDDLAKSQEKSVDLLQQIATGITVLVDRK
jgi:hypothetical protein